LKFGIGNHRHCEERSDEGIQFFRCRSISGLLRFARNDGGTKRRENAELYPSSVMPRLDRHPVRRGFSVQSLPALEYRIARSKLGDDTMRNSLFEI
jgi:hypothetical protein